MKYVICQEGNPEVYHGYYDSLDRATHSLLKISKMTKKKYQLLTEDEHKDILHEREKHIAQSPWVVYDLIDGLSICIKDVSAFDALKYWAKECQLTYDVSEDDAHVYIRIYDEKDTAPVLTARSHKILYPDDQLLNVAAAKILRKAAELLPSNYKVHACTKSRYQAILHEAGLDKDVQYHK